MNKKLLFVVNVDWFFLSHRLPIALAALSQGYEVHIATGITDKRSEMEKHGLVVHPLSLERGRISLFGELKVFVEIFRLFRRLGPDIVHLVTIKPVLFGGIIARLTKVPAVVAAVPGLGFVFVAEGFKAALARCFVARLYKLALSKKNLRVVCQNGEDQEILMRMAGLPAEKVKTLAGSGVDLAVFREEPLPEGVPIIVMAARLLRDKGVVEFVDAARLLRDRGVDARFCLAGEPDLENPASITVTEVSLWKREQVVELLGHREDIAGLFAGATLVVLPSYREGMPKVLLEAAACGRAVITTDVPGCRDAILPGQSGILVPPRNAALLADAIECLIADPVRCTEMGHAGRMLAENRFSIDDIVANHMEFYSELAEVLP